MWSHSGWQKGRTTIFTNTAQYVAGLCHCEPTLNNSSTWVQGSLLENCLLASLYCCTWLLHPWGRISHFLLFIEPHKAPPVSGHFSRSHWMVTAASNWKTWYCPNRLDEITLKPTIHTVKRYQIVLVPKLILEGTGAICNLLPAGLCFPDPHPPGLPTHPCSTLAADPWPGPSFTRLDRRLPEHIMSKVWHSYCCLAGSYLQHHAWFLVLNQEKTKKLKSLLVKFYFCIRKSFIFLLWRNVTRRIKQERSR